MKTEMGFGSPGPYILLTLPVLSLSPPSPEPLCVSRIAIFLEAVYEQTRVAPQHQKFLFEGHFWVLEPNLSAQHIAHTTASSPLTLLSTASETPMGLAFKDREWGPQAGSFLLPTFYKGQGLMIQDID